MEEIKKLTPEQRKVLKNDLEDLLEHPGWKWLQELIKDSNVELGELVLTLMIKRDKDDQEVRDLAIKWNLRERLFKLPQEVIDACSQVDIKNDIEFDPYKDKKNN